MGAPDLLSYLSAKGLSLRPLPDGNLEVSPKSALTDDLRSMIRAHKPELVKVLRSAQAPAGRATGIEPDFDAFGAPETSLARSCSLLLARANAKLDSRPETDLAVIADDELQPDAVLVAVARRHRFACVLRVDPARYDGIKLLELIERHTVH